MNREELKDLELSSEQINSVMGIYGKSVQSLQTEVSETKEALATVTSEKGELETKAGQLDSLQQERDRLARENTELNTKLSDNELDKRILKVISKDAHDPDDIFKFIDKEQFEFDEETGDITNFDDVLGKVKESKPYLFNTQTVVTDDGKQDGHNDTQTPPGTDYSTNKQKGNPKDKTDFAKKGKDLVAQIHGKQED